MNPDTPIILVPAISPALRQPIAGVYLEGAACYRAIGQDERARELEVKASAVLWDGSPATKGDAP